MLKKALINYILPLLVDVIREELDKAKQRKKERKQDKTQVNEVS